MDAYLGAPDDFDYENSLRTSFFLPQTAMTSWPPHSSTFAAMDDPTDPSHHDPASVSSSHQPPHSTTTLPSAAAAYETAFHQHAHQQIPQSRPLMQQPSHWQQHHQQQYAAVTAGSQPSTSGSLHQQPMVTGDLMTDQQQYGSPFITQTQQHSHPAGLDFTMSNQQQLNHQMVMASAPERQYMPYTSSMQEYSALHAYQHDLQTGLAGMPIAQQRLYQDHQYGSSQQSPPFGQAGTLLGASPESANFESLSSSGSESGWQMVDPHPRSSFESYDMPQHPIAVSNPGVNLQLHLRTGSDSSQQADMGSVCSTHSIGSFEEVQFPMGSPTSDTSLDLAVVPARAQPQLIRPHHHEQDSPPLQSSSSSSSSSPTSPTSPTQRRKKEPAAGKAVTKAGVKKTTTQTKKGSDKEKRVGRRKGPLRPEQRAQAGEIRKLRACLRCKFLKKTCDKGDPCAGCQPAHARLWQVPCTRIDIKEIGYFVKDWKADYERHVCLGFSIANIRGYSPLERPLFITHGFGFILPIQAREVFVRDEDCFNIDWVETIKDKPEEFESPTARLTAGIDGVSMPHLSEYLDKHIENGFENWVDQHFGGTIFLTEMLKTAYSFYQRTKMPIIHKALKLILAYNLTLHVTMVEGLSDEEGMVGKIDDENSRYFGKTLAPVMINFQVKHALAMMWRELQKDVLEELSALYSSVYNGERLKNWPTIFMLASILLAVWEEIQFDSHYRMPDGETVRKFCNEMESTPVGVIVGLFGAISQKLPAFQEWDTEKHQHLLNSNEPICDALTEVREHVTKHEEYLKTRADSKFDRGNFDSLSNKFLSKLVIRAN